MIKPFGDNILIELQSSYKKALVTDDRMGETKKQGLCIEVSNSLLIGKDQGKRVHPLLNKIVYFDEFEATTQHVIDGKKYALIDIKNIRGYEE